MDNKERERELKAPASVFGLFTMVITILVILQNRGSENIFLWFSLRAVFMAIFFVIGYGIYIMLDSFCREVLFNGNRGVIITAVVTAVILLIWAATNAYGNNPIL